MPQSHIQLDNVDDVIVKLGGPRYLSRKFNLNRTSIYWWRIRGIPGHYYDAIAKTLATINYEPAKQLFNFRNRKRATWLGDGETLRCPTCDSCRHIVLTTRHHKRTIRRSRKCKNCGFVFFTAERFCDIECRNI